MDQLPRSSTGAGARRGEGREAMDSTGAGGERRSSGKSASCCCMCMLCNIYFFCPRFSYKDGGLAPICEQLGVAMPQ